MENQTYSSRWSSTLSPDVYAACPANILISQAKILIGNIINAFNQRNIAIVLAASSSDATATGSALGPRWEMPTVRERTNWCFLH